MAANDRKSLRDRQIAFAAHIRDPEHAPAPADVEDRRMRIYRELFFNNIQGFLASNFPVLRRLYGEAEWTALARDFFARHRATTPLFPELPREFLRFVEAHRGPETGDPPWLLELAHYEWVELALSLDEAEIDAVAARADADLLDSAPVRSPLAWVLSYRYPVHRIREDYRPTAPPDQPTHLVVYRDRTDRVRFTELNAVSARLLHLLGEFPQRSGRAHLQEIARELEAPDAAPIVEAGRRILEDFRQRDIILGGS